ncbi:MAG TPA: hypothetical protein VF743_05685, partial [Acidimicrobiales bacterium]
PQDPEISERAIGPVREALTSSLGDLDSAGEAVRHGPEHHHAVQSVHLNGREATVTDCSVDDAAIVDAATEEVREQRLVTVLYEAKMLQRDGIWRLSELQQLQGWEGIDGCAASRS